MAGRMLVVEDDANISDMLGEMLRDVADEVILLRHPDLVLDVVAQEHPDVILIDVMLPKKSGVEVADQLWVSGFGTTPLIAMSASSVMLDLARHSPFFQRVLRKPLDMDELLQEVRDVMSECIPAYGQLEGAETNRSRHRDDALSL